MAVSDIFGLRELRFKCVFPTAKRWKTVSKLESVFDVFARTIEAVLYGVE